MDTIALPEDALDVPQLIIANGADNVVGTARPYFCFQRYRKQGAPFTFVIQNRTPHCCVMNVTSLVLLWLDAAIRQRRQAPTGEIDQQRRWLGSQKVEDSGTKDSWHTKVWDVSAAQVSFVTDRAASPTLQGIRL
jgi:hypothetical protein